jgi:hypothetical protein
MRFLDEIIADLADKEVVASAFAAVEVKLDAKDSEPTPPLFIATLFD